MKSAKRGNATSIAEVVHVSSHGFWIMLDPPGRELYLPFGSFPWFREATIRQLSHIEVERQHLLRWPDLDVDLDVDRIEHPERYPLVARTHAREGHGTRRSADTGRGKRRVATGTGSKRTRARRPTAAE
jgi:hypothetical protein